MSFLDQFSGKAFLWTVAGLLCLDVLSFFVLHTAAEPILFSLFVVCAIGVSVWKPEWLFPIAMAEIISTSNGHSLNVELAGISIGLRIALFGVLMVATLIHLSRTRRNPIPERYRLPVILLVGLMLYGVIRGLLSGYDLRILYLDANGYLAIGYLLAAFVWVQDARSRKRLMQLAGAGVVVITFKTLLFLFVFGHLHPKTLNPLYTWIRDTRLGEITLQMGNVYRIFLQSQWFLVPALFVSASYMLLAEKTRENGVRYVHLVVFAAIVASLSRTFWLALACAILLFVVYIVWQKGWRTLASRVPDLVITKIGAVALLWIIIAVPIFQTTGTSIFGSLLRSRATGTDDIALDSRRKLLGPLLTSIAQEPLMGHGLGTQVVYETSDQRYIDGQGTNIVSSYVFEWGWLDLLVKFGLLGTGILLYVFYAIAADLWHASREDRAHTWLYMALFFSFIALLIAHMFSPYLNHPIGWGMIAIIVALVPRTNPAARQRTKDIKAMPVLRPMKQLTTRHH
ncbi:hypothetical protein COV06_00945 [Candidatus Uhrbacteria bacterium CG10_big_fil_rev_8_21_14_0_10_50_16]|uniref:O-antigen ligase-related domain-containing protein n=1 Tax=Candidatus Uhrbacteria bacterium CG10_big_fil_rev_8_21_14_0_10_50_16 TaxID=1975039 RepID=A0A2H0RN30_9BACT|nr:MAG: hypothetical protein COV06_00945 [Candidatus Uhrbacteria bacterium CG10_big_fil_rev_8_21_14_0_10_50_16]